MNSSLTIARKYLNWYAKASNSKGHGVHSPFVYSFIRNVLLDKKEPDYFNLIEALRRRLLHDNDTISVIDFGAGSSVIKTDERVIKKIAASSLKAKKYAQLLSRMVQYFKPSNILELGTSFGISTSYMAMANHCTPVYTMEGSPEIAKIADQNFQELGIKNINLVVGDFADNFQRTIEAMDVVDFAFIDGNHQQKPTELYFSELLKRSTEKSVFIFDDIYWSRGMENAWQNIKNHPSVTLTVDLFFFGIVFLDPTFKEKQHISIRY